MDINVLQEHDKSILHANRGWFQTEREQAQMTCQEEIPNCWGEIGEALEVAVHRSQRCPISVSVQGQVRWGSEQPGVEEGVPVYDRWVGTR